MLDINEWASADLEDIFIYISQTDVERAKKLIQSLTSKFKLLEKIHCSGGHATTFW